MSGRGRKRRGGKGRGGSRERCEWVFEREYLFWGYWGFGFDMGLQKAWYSIALLGE